MKSSLGLWTRHISVERPQFSDTLGLEAKEWMFDKKKERKKELELSCACTDNQ